MDNLEHLNKELVDSLTKGYKNNLKSPIDSIALRTANDALRQEIEDLKQQIDEKDKQISKLKDRLFGMNKYKSFQEWKNSREEALQYYLEAMVTAYQNETDIPPDKAVLHTAYKNDGSAHIYYWIEHEDDVKRLNLHPGSNFKIFE